MPSIWTQWATRRARLAQEDVRELIAQFYVTLEASFAKVKSAEAKLPEEAFRRVEQLLAAEQPRNWTNAYAVEQLLIHLFDDDSVVTELQIRVREAKTVSENRGATTSGTRPMMSLPASCTRRWPPISRRWRSRGPSTSRPSA